MILIDTILFAALVIFCYMTLLFILALVIKDNSIADIAWGPGFIIAAFAAVWYNRSFDALQVIVVLMVTVWGLRLGSGFSCATAAAEKTPVTGNGANHGGSSSFSGATSRSSCSRVAYSW